MSQRIRQGQPMIIMGEGAQRVEDRNVQGYNTRAARVVAEAVRSIFDPKGMDKMLVDSMGDVTITNDGVTILEEMDIDNPTAEVIIKVAKTQEDEAGDGTTTAVAITGELLKNAEDPLERDVHPMAIIRSFNLASGKTREKIDNIAERVDPDDEELLKKVTETSMADKSSELNEELLADLIIHAVRQVTVGTDDGSHVVDLENVSIKTQTDHSVSESELLTGTVTDKDPVHDDMPVQFGEADVLLLSEPAEVEGTDIGTNISIENPDQLQRFLDQEEAQLKQEADQVVNSGADVIFCQKNIDDPAQHYLAKQGVLAVRQTKKSDIRFLKNITGATVVSDLDPIETAVLDRASVRRDGAGELFYVKGIGDDVHGVTLLLRGSTNRVVDELEHGAQDTLGVVASTIADGRVLVGGGAIEVKLISRLRNYTDSISEREQLAVEAYAGVLELVPRVLTENAGLDSIDTLVDLRAAHEDGQIRARLNVFTGRVEDAFNADVVETTHAKEQAIASASEAANLVLKIDDIIAAGDLSTDDDDDEGGGAPGGMGGMGDMGGMGGAM